MPIRTKRWNDPRETSDGYRLLITRYRPRGVSKAQETWDAWEPAFGPSKELHAGVYTTSASPIAWPAYRKLYLQEQQANQLKIQALAERVAQGETITLLCSSACERESRCHRSLLRELIEAAAPHAPRPDGETRTSA
jgi:uncharacterized protein YeaO (DUF488 family)